MMNDIEKLAREQLAHAEEMPPAEVWTRLQQRIHAQTPATPSHPTGAGRLWRWLLPVAALPVVGVALFFAFRSSPTDAVVGRQTAEVITESPSVDDGQDATPQTAMTSSDALPVTERNGNVAVTAFKDAASSPAVAATEPATAVATSDSRAIKAAVQPDKRTVPAVGMAPAIQMSDDTPTVMPGGNKDSVRNSASAVVTESAHKNTTSATNAHDQQMAREAVDKLLMIPNLITPNFDGYNDCWVLKNMESLGSVQVQIFTAQSKRVFSSSNYQNDFCGDDLPDGNYFYVVAIRDKQYIRRGVLVIRH